MMQRILFDTSSRAAGVLRDGALADVAECCGCTSIISLSVRSEREKMIVHMIVGHDARSSDGGGSEAER